MTATEARIQNPDVSELLKRQRADIERRFTYHPPKDGQPELYVAIREKGKELALLIAELTPPSREQSSALTKVDEAVMHANAAIARNG